MKNWKTLAAAVAALAATHAGATPTADEAAQLGKTLTPMGAEKAANKDGSIPEWTGGLCKAPAGYKPRNGVGGLPYLDPFADEKPLYSVTAANAGQYADKLDEGQKYLLKQYPSYRIDVYPTHRTACLPEWVYENTIKRVMSPKLVGDAPGLEGARAQIPFPIPKTGQEAMYNNTTVYRPVYYGGDYNTWLMDSAGNRTLVQRGTIRYHYPYWDTTKTSDILNQLINSNNSPASKSGSMDMRIQWLRMDQKEPKAWAYTPGQRRVRLAPEFTYDTVAAQYGGLILFDEINGFDGKMDRFDFKLLGKKELLIPYNGYKLLNASLDDQLAKKSHHNPDLVRFELHRVWVVEATRKPGARHIYSKKVFYIDEDSWNIAAYQGYDDTGKLYRAQFYPVWQSYESPATITFNALIYDFVKNGWALGSVPVVAGYQKMDSLPENYFTPDSMAAMGVR